MPRRPDVSVHERSTAERAERRRQIRGLLILAALVLAFTILRAGPDRIFTHGWWRIW